MMFLDDKLQRLNVNIRMMALSVAASMLLCTTVANAAVDMFIKLGKIEGEAEDDEHKGEIDVLAWSWGQSQSGTTHMGGGGAGKVAVQDLSFTKFVDSASHTLIQRVADGAHIKEATLTVRKAGTTALEFIVIKLEDVMVTSVETGGSGGEDRLTENVTLNFARYAVIYTPQKDDGTGEAALTSGWDIAANEAIAIAHSPPRKVVDVGSPSSGQPTVQEPVTPIDVGSPSSGQPTVQDPVAATIDEYTALSGMTGVALAGYPKPTSLWGIPASWTTIDGGLYWPERGNVYLFHGSEYTALNGKTGLALAGYPKSTSAWGIPASWTTIDGGVYWPERGNVYLFNRPTVQEFATHVDVASLSTGQPTLQEPGTAVLDASMVVGNYAFDDPQNNPFFRGSISRDGDQLRWTGEDTRTWGLLTHDLARGRLQTDEYNPYYNNGHREFELLTERTGETVKVVGFVFATRTYNRAESTGVLVDTPSSGQPTVEAPVEATLDASMVVGTYAFDDPQNNPFFTGSISRDGDQLRWTSDDTRTWGLLTHELARGRLHTDENNPYYNNGYREFELLIDKTGEAVKVVGFIFATRTYKRND